jgi:hypothetical protein
MEGVTGIHPPDGHSFRWVFGGSNHPDREDDETQRPHLAQLHTGVALTRPCHLSILLVDKVLAIALQLNKTRRISS